MQLPHRPHLVDRVCLRYCQEAQANGVLAVYLFALLYSDLWASTGNCDYLHSKVVPYISGRELNYLQWLITPEHINNNTGIFFALKWFRTKLFLMMG